MSNFRSRLVRLASSLAVVLVAVAITSADPPRGMLAGFRPQAGAVLDSATAGDAPQPVAQVAAQAGMPDFLRHVVIARMYQANVWTIPAADTYHSDRYPNVLDRRIAYVCGALAYLRPGYVSGLIRLDWLPLAPRQATEQAYVFDGVRRCVRDKVGQHVRFDVVLNALHYTDPHPTNPKPGQAVPDAKAGADRLRERLRTAQDTFHPDGWFFDFYASPYKKGTQRFPEALEAGIRWIHDDKALGKPKPRQFVGGTLWGTEVPVPPGSDFIAITDRGGMDYTRHLVEHFGPRNVPILMHIDNDPQNPDSQGSQFYDGTRDRKAVLQRHAHGQSNGYTYMFPVFFPLKDSGGPAFDMRAHPDLLKTMCGLARDNCGPPPA